MATDTDDEGPTAFVWSAGWSSITPDSSGMARVGAIMVPAAFDVHASRPAGDGSSSFDAVLSYEVVDGDLRLSRVQSVTHEIDQAMQLLQRAFPWEVWKRNSLVMLAADATEDSGGSPKDVQGAMRTAGAIPVRRSGSRVTDAMLRDVARIYRSAVAAGHPPTRAVSEHFFNSHSTAARWVGLARRRGYLGRAAGTRGGEITEGNESDD